MFVDMKIQISSMKLQDPATKWLMDRVGVFT